MIVFQAKCANLQNNKRYRDYTITRTIRIWIWSPGWVWIIPGPFKINPAHRAWKARGRQVYEKAVNKTKETNKRNGKTTLSRVKLVKWRENPKTGKFSKLLPPVRIFRDTVPRQSFFTAELKILPAHSLLDYLLKSSIVYFSFFIIIIYKLFFPTWDSRIFL